MASIGTVVGGGNLFEYGFRQRMRVDVHVCVALPRLVGLASETFRHKYHPLLLNLPDLADGQLGRGGR